MIRRWRESQDWTQRAHLAKLKAFFRFAEREGRVSESPAAGLAPPRANAAPTLPLGVDEMMVLLEASARKPSERALLLLLRYSGLSIGDAVTLPRAALRAAGELVLRRAKAGALVTMQLRDYALEALEPIAEEGRERQFWTGRSEPVTAAKYWQARLRKVARVAGSEGLPPAQAAGRLRGGASAGRRGHARRLGAAGPRQRRDHGALLRAVEFREA